MKSNYSRRQRLDTRSDTKSAVFYIVLTIIAILAIIFFGIPLIGKVAGFLHDISSSNQPVDISDTTPPAPPSLEFLPEFTNKTNIEVFGHTEAGVTVTLYLNDNDEELLANSDGAFSYEWDLIKGENKVRAKVKDSAGNESSDSKTYKVTYDDTAPSLEIESPANGKQFSGPKERQTSIKGSSEDGASVTINDRIVALDTAGNFSFFTTLTSGENKFTVKAKDEAGNEVEQSLIVNFIP